MKTLHIKFKILKERQSLFDCMLIQHNVVLNMISIGQIGKEKVHPCGDGMGDVTKKNECLPRESF